MKCLEKYHQRYLKRIFNIRCQDRQTNNSVLEETNSTSIAAMIIRHQLRWDGHIVRMPDSRLPKQIMYAQLRNRQRNQGEQFKQYKDAQALFIKISKNCKYKSFRNFSDPQDIQKQMNNGN